MSAALRRSDYDHAVRKDAAGSVGEVSMGILPRVSAADEAALGAQAADWAPGWRALTLRNVIFRGRRLTVRVARDPTGAVRLSGLQ